MTNQLWSPSNIVIHENSWDKSKNSTKSVTCWEDAQPCQDTTQEPAKVIEKELAQARANALPRHYKCMVANQW